MILGGGNSKIVLCSHLSLGEMIQFDYCNIDGLKPPSDLFKVICGECSTISLDLLKVMLCVFEGFQHPIRLISHNPKTNHLLGECEEVSLGTQPIQQKS